MLIEETQLTLANVGLGTLSEYAVMVLFANAFCHRITRGTKLVGIREIQDGAGRALYPANFLTHLRVPSSRLLQDFAIWDQVAVGVDVHSFGRMLLDSLCVLGRPGEIPADRKQWQPEHLPSMRIGTLFIRDERRDDPDAAVPREGHLAELPALSAPPDSVTRFGEVQSLGGRLPEYDGKLTLERPIRYPIIAERDVALGHAVMFATFIQIMDLAERQFLTEHLSPPFYEELVNRRAVLERETFYLSNCFAGDVLRIDLKGKLLPPPATLQLAAAELVPAALLETVVEVHQEGRNALLCVSRVKKVLAIPRAMKTARREAERMLNRHGGTR